MCQHEVTSPRTNLWRKIRGGGGGGGGGGGEEKEEDKEEEEEEEEKEEVGIIIVHTHACVKYGIRTFLTGTLAICS